MSNFKTVDVIFKNPTYNYTTSVNPNATDEELKKYFIGTFFNLGNAEKDDMQKCINIKIKN